jgi:hypothetical protein
MALSKAEREAGYRPVPQPSPEQVTVLRRVSAGYLMRTHRVDDNGKSRVEFSYEDGSRMTSLAKPGARCDDEKIVNGMIANGWLIPIEGETLIDGAPPQRYRARTAEDGPLPRFVKR